TDALLEVMYPHYLRPFPSCSVAHFDMGQAAAKLSAPVHVARGTQLQSRPVKGVNCRFRTAYDVDLLPLALTRAEYRAVADAPMATSLPPGAGGRISLEFELLSDQVPFDGLGVEALRLFITASPRSAPPCAMPWRCRSWLRGWKPT